MCRVWGHSSLSPALFRYQQSFLLLSMHGNRQKVLISPWESTPMNVVRTGFQPLERQGAMLSVACPPSVGEHFFSKITSDPEENK